MELLVGSSNLRAIPVSNPIPLRLLTSVEAPPETSRPQLDPLPLPGSPYEPEGGGRRQWLVQRGGSFWERGRILEFPPSINEGTIGRSFSCTWRVNDPTVSRIHAALVRRPRRGVYLVDLASRTGTFVNDRSVDGELLLMDGDVIRFGPRVIVEYIDGPLPRLAEPERRWIKRLWWSVAGLGGVLAIAAILL